jgi:hypothetical protein
MGGGGGSVQGRAKKWRGLARSEVGSATWADMAQTQQLWAAPTAVGEACLVGATGVGCEQGRTVACATQDGAADRWGWDKTGPGGSGQGVSKSVSERSGGDGAPTGGPRQRNAGRRG